jgi:predicted Zn-dependent peptidase
VAERTVVAAAGDIDPAAFFALAERLFGDMPRSADASPLAAPEPAASIANALGRPFRQVSQVFVNIGYPVTPPAAQQMHEARWRLAASVAAMLFGGGMSAPFTDTVRERLGLAYTAESTSEHGDAWFTFIVHAITTPDKVEQLLAATGTLLREHADAIDPLHLERARNQLVVARVRSAERTYATMEHAVEELFMRGAVTPVSDTIAIIESITADEVRAVFERMLAHEPALAITGKAASKTTARRLAARLAAAVRSS